MEYKQPIEIESKTLGRAQKIGHELWRKVFIRQSFAKNEPPINYKYLNTLNDKDDEIYNLFLNSTDSQIFIIEASPEQGIRGKINITSVGFTLIPEEFKASTTKSLNIGFEAIEKRFTEIQEKQDSANLDTNLHNSILQIIELEVGKIRDILKNQQDGIPPSKEELELIANSWVIQTGIDIHNSWRDEFPDRQDLAEEYEKLDPFEKDKDIVFIEAAIRAKMLEAGI